MTMIVTMQNYHNEVMTVGVLATAIMMARWSCCQTIRFAKDGTQLVGEWEDGKIVSGKLLGCIFCSQHEGGVHF